MTLHNNIYDKLKEAIIYGELSPGEKLSENELAKKMNASRTPIREALRKLEIEGYVVISPNKGASVSKLPAEEIENIYNIVRVLEGYAAELTARRVSREELMKLKEIQNEVSSRAQAKKYRGYVEENTKFHRFITALSGNNCLVKTVTELRARIYRYRLTSVTIPGYLERYASDHERIIESIAEGDSVGARKFMEEHVGFVKEVLVEFLKDNPGY